jgi:hypothetical protein
MEINVAKELETLREVLKYQSLTVDWMTQSLAPPLMCISGRGCSGYRYEEPTVKHFCLLQIVKALSGLNAALVLAEHGFNQEMCVIIRTIIEATSKIDFILSGYKDDELADKQKTYLDDYFADIIRNGSDDSKGAVLRQERIHKEIQLHMRKSFSGTEHEERFAGVEVKGLLSNVYRIFSNYVHGKYPEIMDMYGERPRQFYTNGMKGTPKDVESVEGIKPYVDSVSITLILMVPHFGPVAELSGIGELMESISMKL